MQGSSNASLFFWVEFSENMLSPKHWCFWDFIFDSLPQKNQTNFLHYSVVFSPPAERTLPNFICQGRHVSK